MDSFLFISSTVFPVFIIILLGFILANKNIINKEFSTVSSKLVFNVALPCLIFKEITGIPIATLIDGSYVGFLYAATLLSAVLAWYIGKILHYEPATQGAFVQGSFRGNFAIIGLALVANAGDATLLSRSAVTLAFIMPFYNVLSILVLLVPNRKANGVSAWAIAKGIYTNPLILTLVAGLAFSALQFTLPEVLIKSMNYLSALAVPLALVGIGASLSGNRIANLPSAAFVATVLKVLVFPVILTVLAYYYGFRGDQLFILFILFSSPTAIVSYIMAEAMGADSYLAGAIILLTTIVSVVTISIGLIIMKSLGLY